MKTKLQNVLTLLLATLMLPVAMYAQSNQRHSVLSKAQAEMNPREFKSLMFEQKKLLNPLTENRRFNPTHIEPTGTVPTGNIYFSDIDTYDIGYHPLSGPFSPYTTITTITEIGRSY